MWFQESVAPDEVAFDDGVFLLRKATPETLRAGKPALPTPSPEPDLGPVTAPGPEPSLTPGPVTEPTTSTRTLRVTGAVPPEVWNRLGTKILPKLRSGSELRIGLELSVTVSADSAVGLANELRQVLQELGLAEEVRVE